MDDIDRVTDPPAYHSLRLLPRPTATTNCRAAGSGRGDDLLKSSHIIITLSKHFIRNIVSSFSI